LSVRAAIEQSIAAASGSSVSITHQHEISGGSINRAYRIESDAHSYFLKLNQADQLPMFEAEAAGLHELATANAMRVPLPICHGAAAGQSWLVTEYIEFGSGERDSDYLFGQQMAVLHRQPSEQFGWMQDNTIGSTAQYNGHMQDWVDFYRERRLRVQFELAAQHGFRASLLSKGERLMQCLPAFFTGYAPRPSLLHGDLWAGNYAFDTTGQAVIFDPAVYYGDREADIAMTELFGGFGADFYAGYHEAWSLDDGYAVRKTLYNLYHILNHASLFGGSYAAQAESMIDRLLAEI
jgi:fructosamine-3-kinase